MSKSKKIFKIYLIFSLVITAAFSSSFFLYPKIASANLSADLGLGIPVDALTGQAALTFPKVNDGAILVSVSDNQGGWYIGGTFTKVGNIERNKIAHIFQNGSVDPNWNPEVVGAGIYSMYLDLASSLLYIGGQFSSVGGKTRNNIAAVDSTSGSVAIWDPNVSESVGGSGASVNALAMGNASSTMYVAGQFSSAGGQARNHIAAIDTRTGLATLWNPNIGGENAYIKTLSLGYGKSTIFIGGNFNFVGTQARKNIAAIDINMGQATPWNPGANAIVSNSVLNYSGDLLYVGGDFTSVGAGQTTYTGQARNHLAVIDTNTAEPVFWNPNPNGLVSAITLNPSETIIYVGGQFTSIGGQERNRVAALDTGTGLPLPWNPGIDYDVHSLSLNSSKNFIYIGGGKLSPAGEATSTLPVSTTTPAPPPPITENTVKEVTVPILYSFSRNLSFGMTGDDVRELQKYLNKNGFVVAFSLAGSSGNETDYFGPATKAALIRFQNVHRAELGITRGTGYFGPLTRALINK